jgi:ribonuclease P protein component
MGRIVRPADFQRVLGKPPWARSVHFAVHHLAEAPSRPAFSTARSTELSTDQQQACPPLVDECRAEASNLLEAVAGGLVLDVQVASGPAADGGVGAALPLCGCWLGMVVPKRHAKRSVTRSLIKRQIRSAVHRAGGTVAGHGPLNAGLWVVRLRAPIDRKRFKSAASDALRAALHEELAQVMAKAVSRCHA